jgi:hypothetical protein
LVLETLSQKYPTQKSAGGVAQGIDPDSNPSTGREGEKKKKKNQAWELLPIMPVIPATWETSVGGL